MEVKIGVQHVGRELVVETDMSPAEVAKVVETALAGGTLDLTDAKGRRVMVAGATIAYVDIGTPDRAPVGFAS